MGTWAQDIAINTLWYNNTAGEDPTEGTVPVGPSNGAVAVNTADGKMWIRVLTGGLGSGANLWEEVVSGSGTVNPGTAFYFPFYTADGTTIDDNVTISGNNNVSPLYFVPTSNSLLPTELRITTSRVKLSGEMEPLTNNQSELGNQVMWWRNVFSESYHMSRLVSGNARSVALTASATLAANYTLTLPAAAPINTSMLQSDGSGNLSWVKGTVVVSGGLTQTQIQTAIDTVEAAGGGIVVIPQGTYSITAPIVLEADVPMLIQGYGAKLQAAASNLEAILKIDRYNGGAASLLAVQGLHIDGVKASYTNNRGIRIIDTDKIRLSDIKIEDCDKEGLDLYVGAADGTASWVEFCQFERIQIQNCGTGVHFNRGSIYTAGTATQVLTTTYTTGTATQSNAAGDGAGEFIAGANSAVWTAAMVGYTFTFTGDSDGGGIITEWIDATHIKVKTPDESTTSTPVHLSGNYTITGSVVTGSNTVWFEKEVVGRTLTFGGGGGLITGWLDTNRIIVASSANVDSGSYSISAYTVVTSCFGNTFITVGVNGCTTGWDIDYLTNLTRCVFSNTVTWLGDNQTGWNIKGDMKEVQVDLHVEAQGTPTNIIGILIGPTAYNMTRWSPHYSFVGGFNTKLSDPNKFLYPSWQPFEILGWDAVGPTPPVKYSSGTGGNDYSGWKFLGDNYGLLRQITRVPDDYVGETLTFALEMFWTTPDSSATGDVRWAIHVGAIQPDSTTYVLNHYEANYSVVPALTRTVPSTAHQMKNIRWFFTEPLLVRRGDCLRIAVIRDGIDAGNLPNPSRDTTTNDVVLVALAISYKRYD